MLNFKNKLSTYTENFVSYNPNKYNYRKINTCSLESAATAHVSYFKYNGSKSTPFNNNPRGRKGSL